MRGKPINNSTEIPRLLIYLFWCFLRIRKISPSLYVAVSTLNLRHTVKFHPMVIPVDPSLRKSTPSPNVCCKFLFDAHFSGFAPLCVSPCSCVNWVTEQQHNNSNQSANAPPSPLLTTHNQEARQKAMIPN